MQISSTSPLRDSTKANYRVTVGQYSECMYFVNSPSHVSDTDQDVFDYLLDSNQGVGIIVGYFDENYSIKMMSFLASRVIGLESPREYFDTYGTSLFGIVANDNEREFIKEKLSNPEDNVWTYCVETKNNFRISIRVSSIISTNSNGQKMWYMSIRRFGEVEHDALTGGLNRTGFINKVEKLRADGTDLCNYAILYVNIRGFKAINEIYGVHSGDYLLMSVYNHFISCKLHPLFVARKESDKFTMIVHKANLDLDELPSILKIPVDFNGEKHTLESACGVYYIANPDASITNMMDCAKLAKAHIDDSFIKPYEIFESKMKEHYINYTIALSNFDSALKNNEFTVYFQPIIDVKTRKVASAEALVRWKQSDGTIVSPGVFIPALEENGHIVRLDRFVYRYVADFIHARHDADKPCVPVSVNFSRMDFFDTKRMKIFMERQENDPLVRSMVHIEITETSYKQIKHAQEAFIKKMNEYGGKVYIDDFGTANSSIDLLSQYNFSVLKLDMHFVNELLKNDKVRILVGTTINMAHQLGMQVIAEGVEDEALVDALAELDCDYIQGYYFSKPLPVEDFIEYLEAHI